MSNCLHEKPTTLFFFFSHGPEIYYEVAGVVKERVSKGH